MNLTKYLSTNVGNIWSTILWELGVTITNNNEIILSPDFQASIPGDMNISDGHSGKENREDPLLAPEY